MPPPVLLPVLAAEQAGPRTGRDLLGDTRGQMNPDPGHSRSVLPVTS